MATQRSSSAVDVAVIGGGVSGAATAIGLAGLGLRVALVEKEIAFRDRMRGDAIHPWGLREAIRVGLLDVVASHGGHPLPIWRTYVDRQPASDYHWADDDPDGLSEWSVNLPVLQEGLLQQAMEAGVTVVRPAKVISLRYGVTPELNVIDPTGASRVIRARLIVGADGRTSQVRKWIGAIRMEDPAHHMLGGFLFGGLALDRSAAHASEFTGGRFFFLPRANGDARLYLVCTSEQAAQWRPGGYETAVDVAAELLPEGTMDGWSRAGEFGYFPNQDSWSDRLVTNDVVLVGDAAGANDPSVGQGLSLAFRDARVLRDVLDEAGREGDWAAALGEYARQRQASFSALNAHARWTGILLNEVGPIAEARLERVKLAREADGFVGGWGSIFITGPDGLVPDEAARRLFFAEGT